MDRLIYHAAQEWEGVISPEGRNRQVDGTATSQTIQ